ncbi:MAG: cell division protein FtsL [Gammaproteobacteria bacterium]
MRINGPFINIFNNKVFFMLTITALIAISSALSVIYSKHKSRMLHILLQNIYTEHSNLNTEWSRLILEKSTLMTDFRIEQIAKQTLNMNIPEQIEFIGP